LNTDIFNLLLLVRLQHGGGEITIATSGGRRGLLRQQTERAGQVADGAGRDAGLSGGPLFQGYLSAARSTVL